MVSISISCFIYMHTSTFLFGSTTTIVRDPRPTAANLNTYYVFDRAARSCRRHIALDHTCYASLPPGPTGKSSHAIVKSEAEVFAMPPTARNVHDQRTGSGETLLANAP